MLTDISDEIKYALMVLVCNGDRYETPCITGKMSNLEFRNLHCKYEHNQVK